VGGQVTQQSPLTNFSDVTSPGVTTMYFRYVPSNCPSCDPQIDLEGLNQSFPHDSVYQPVDSLFALRWTQVAGAAGYWIQVYQPVGNVLDRLRAARPSPIFLDASRDFFVGYVPAPADSYKIGSPGALVVTRKTTLNNTEYLVRVAAVNADGELIGFLYGDTTSIFTTSGALGRVATGAIRLKSKPPAHRPR